MATNGGSDKLTEILPQG